MSTPAKGKRRKPKFHVGQIVVLGSGHEWRGPKKCKGGKVHSGCCECGWSCSPFSRSCEIQHVAHVASVAQAAPAAICLTCGKEYGTYEDLHAHVADLHDGVSAPARPQEVPAPDYARIIAEDDATLKTMQAKQNPEWRTVIVGLPILRKLLNGEDVTLESFRISLIPDDVLFNASPVPLSRQPGQPKVG